MSAKHEPITDVKLQPHERWPQLLRTLIAEIDAIDQATPATSSREPIWWLDMMQVDRAARKLLESENSKE